jgi:hypothetical protein
VEQILTDLRAENARLQERVEEAERWYADLIHTHDDVTLPLLYEADSDLARYKALAEQRKEALAELVGNINLVTTQGGNLYVLYVAVLERAEAALDVARAAIEEGKR